MTVDTVTQMRRAKSGGGFGRYGMSTMVAFGGDEFRRHERMRRRSSDDGCQSVMRPPDVVGDFLEALRSWEPA